MTTSEKNVSRALTALAVQWGSGLDSDAQRRLVRYVQELERWNRRINLVRYSDVDQLVFRHLADGFAAARHIPASASAVLDVGAGAGIPGAIVAALRPALEVVALEPIHKKHAFLRSLRRTLPLRNFKPFAARLGGEDEPEGLEGRFDVAISRATWSIDDWLVKGARLVRPGGLVLGLEGRERATLVAGATRHPYEADGRERAIISLRTP